MWNLLAVLSGSIILAWLLFLRRPGAEKVLSASRWMLLAWGFLTLVHFASPIHYQTLRLSLSTWLYCGLWVGCFVLADNVRFTFGAKSMPMRSSAQCAKCPERMMQVLVLVAVVGAVLLIHIRMQTVASSDLASLLSDLRDTQIGGSDSGLAKTVATVLACLGLVVALIDTSNAVRTQCRPPLRAGIALLAYFAVTVSTGGRPGIVLGTVSLFVTVIASVYLAELGFAKFRALLVIGAVVVVTAFGYMMVVVSTRTNGWTGGMDNKVTVMNMMWASELEPGFRESLQRVGVVGDTVVESFYYISPQLYGLDHALHNYLGPFGMGGAQFPVIARRVESLFGIEILDPLNESDTRIFDRVGVSPHFFRTAVHTTFVDFGALLSVPFVFVCGVLTRRARLRALQSRAPFYVAFQALICCGVAWTIIYSPFAEQSWSFPLMWFVFIEVLIEGVYPLLAFLSMPVRSAHDAGVSYSIDFL
jgi:hypothetical protein